MAVNPPPVANVMAIQGNTITVQVEKLPGVANEVRFHISRNGTRAEIFSVDEARRVLAALTSELAKASALSLPTKQ